MNKTLFFLLLFSFSIDAQSQKSKIHKIDVDTGKSSIEWTGKKLTGEHYGKISVLNGYLLVDSNRLTGGSFAIDMNTITCTDITDEKSNNRLVDHLKSEDFFSVGKFPLSRFVITEVVYKGGDAYEITGDLTIKEKTHPLTFPAIVIIRSKVVTAIATLVFDRSKYNVKFGSQSFFENLGDKLVYDEVEMKVDLSGSVPSAQ